MPGKCLDGFHKFVSKNTNAAKATASNFLATPVIDIASVTLECAIVKIFIVFRKKSCIATYRNWSIFPHERKLISKCLDAKQEACQI